MKTVMREKQWAEKYPDLGAGPLPTAPYVSDEQFARCYSARGLHADRRDKLLKWRDTRGSQLHAEQHPRS